MYNDLENGIVVEDNVYNEQTDLQNKYRNAVAIYCDIVKDFCNYLCLTR